MAVGLPVARLGTLPYYGDTTAATTHHAALVKYYDNFERQYNSTGRQYATAGDWVPPPPQPMGTTI